MCQTTETSNRIATARKSWRLHSPSSCASFAREQDLRARYTSRRLHDPLPRNRRFIHFRLLLGLPTFQKRHIEQPNRMHINSIPRSQKCWTFLCWFLSCINEDSLVTLSSNIRSQTLPSTWERHQYSMDCTTDRSMARREPTLTFQPRSWTTSERSRRGYSCRSCNLRCQSYGDMPLFHEQTEDSSDAWTDQLHSH